MELAGRENGSILLFYFLFLTKLLVGVFETNLI